MFKEYQHIERFGTSAVENIEFGECYVFPKIDGTNASVWMENGVVCAGSRRRQLSLESDNAGFYAWVIEQENIKKYLEANPDHRLYGEWLVPHSLKTYREDAWRDFYVFDVTVDISSEGEYYENYEKYSKDMEEFDINYIPPIRIVKSGSFEQFNNLLEANNYLIVDGQGAGEGIVLKNYNYKNKFGRINWAKIVTSEFKEKHHKEMGAPVVNGTTMIEEKIVEKYCTTALIEKEYAKIENEEKEGWSGKCIPRLLGTVYHCIVTEECWNFIKEHKNPTVNFKTLQYFVINKVKQFLNI